MEYIVYCMDESFIDTISIKIKFILNWFYHNGMKMAWLNLTIKVNKFTLLLIPKQRSVKTLIDLTNKLFILTKRLFELRNLNFLKQTKNYSMVVKCPLNKIYSGKSKREKCFTYIE